MGGAGKVRVMGSGVRVLMDEVVDGRRGKRRAACSEGGVFAAHVTELRARIHQ